MTHTYFYTLRPPDIGCQPDGWADRAGGLPKTDWQRTDGTTIKAFGWVEYEKPLTFWEIDHYDLQPDDIIERVRLQFWYKADREPARARVLELEYIGAWLKNAELMKMAQTADFARIQKIVDALIDTQTDQPG